MLSKSFTPFYFVCKISAAAYQLIFIPCPPSISELFLGFKLITVQYSTVCMFGTSHYRMADSIYFVLSMSNGDSRYTSKMTLCFIFVHK